MWSPGISKTWSPGVSNYRLVLVDELYKWSTPKWRAIVYSYLPENIVLKDKVGEGTIQIPCELIPMLIPFRSEEPTCPKYQHIGFILRNVPLC